MVEDDQYTGARIYITRQNAVSRRLLNEDELWEKLSAAGFKKYLLEEMSIEEQVKLFYNAEVIAGTHGAGFTNLCFCKTGTKVLEIFPPTYINQSYWTIASDLKLKYHYVIGEGKDTTTVNDHLKESDIHLSAFQIKEIEKFAL
jgi:capsular polysaccharide biosynthesis protein